MSAARPPSTTDFFRTLQAWVQGTYPGDAAIKIAVRLSTGRTIRQDVPIPTQPEKTDTDDAGKREISRSYLKKVYKSVPECDQEPITSKALSRQAKVTHNSHFYHALRTLQERGYIEQISFKYRKLPK